MARKPQPNGRCWCGCGGETKRFFLPGHDSVALFSALRTEYGDVPGFLNAHGYGPQTRSLSNSSESTGTTWQEESLGFKRLTPENWLEPDSVMRAFGRLPDVGEPYVPTGEERVRDVMGIEMAEEVPLEVRRLFASAKGALCYGYFFHPLYSLASEQLSRVAETAVARKYEAVGGPKPKKTNFMGKLDYLKREGLVSKRDAMW